MKDSQKFLSVVLGTGLMVLCCAAPIALVLFGTAGLAALAGYLDYLLFAALAIGSSVRSTEVSCATVELRFRDGL